MSESVWTDEQWTDEQLAAHRLQQLEASLLQRDTEIEVMRAALLRIAFDKHLSNLAGDPSRWPYCVAYMALGGRVVAGVQIDQKRLRAEAEPHCVGETVPCP